MLTPETLRFAVRVLRMVIFSSAILQDHKQNCPIFTAMLQDAVLWRLAAGTSGFLLVPDGHPMKTIQDRLLRQGED